MDKIRKKDSKRKRNYFDFYLGKLDEPAFERWKNERKWKNQMQICGQERKRKIEKAEN